MSKFFQQTVFGSTWFECRPVQCVKCNKKYTYFETGWIQRCACGSQQFRFAVVKLRLRKKVGK